MMAECLECQRLRKKYDELETQYVLQVNRWLMLKRFILEQESKETGNEHQESPQGR